MFRGCGGKSTEVAGEQSDSLAGVRLGGGMAKHASLDKDHHHVLPQVSPLDRPHGRCQSALVYLL